MLMPAAVLVVIVLGAIAIDQSVVFIHQRDLIAGAAAAANDAATFGIDRAAFYEDGSVSYDPARVRAAARSALEQRRISPRTMEVTISPDGERLVVTLTSDAESIFAKAIPGALSRTTVTATASARLLQD